MGSDARKSYKKVNIDVHTQLIIHWERLPPLECIRKVVDRKKSMVVVVVVVGRGGRGGHVSSLRVFTLNRLDFRHCIATTL